MTEEEVKIWAYWVTHVFQPTNRKVKNVIEGNAHLFTEGSMPSFFLDLLAHIDQYESVVAAWNSGDFSKLNTSIAYPKVVDQYVSREYERVVKLHAQLIGRRLGRGISLARKIAPESVHYP
jgi:hypothetical protein